MNLAYAIDRLYEVGWEVNDDSEVETLADGRKFPSVIAVQREFAQAGLELAIKDNMIFKCYRATWGPAGEPLDEKHASDDKHGTVIGACEREAAVYALAQLRSSQAKNEAALV